MHGEGDLERRDALGEVGEVGEADTADPREGLRETETDKFGVMGGVGRYVSFCAVLRFVGVT